MQVDCSWLFVRASVLVRVRSRVRVCVGVCVRVCVIACPCGHSQT